MPTYEQKCREAFGVEEWRAGILADSALIGPLRVEKEDGREEMNGRAACEFSSTGPSSPSVTEQKRDSNPPPIIPKDDRCTRLEEHPTSPRSLGSKAPGWSKLRRTIGLFLGFVVLYMLAGQMPMERHLDILDSSIPLISQAWRISLAPSSALDRHKAHRRRKELESWIERQQVVAWDRIASNIGLAAGAGDGIVIASPSAGHSLTEPDYYVSSHSSGAD
jgi:hypothetical protein